MDKIKGKFWLRGQSPNSHNCHKVPESRMTAMEGCSYFGIERCCRVIMNNHPRPPFDQESIAMRPLKEVVWSIVGAAGSIVNNDGKGDIDEVLRQADIFPNISGGVLDDFFVGDRLKAFPPESIRNISDKLKHGAKRPLDLWVVVYEHQIDNPIKEYLNYCDVITFWTWKSEHLVDAEDNYKKLVDMTPGKKHLVGCYMYDYGNNRPMPLELMKKQCDLYYKWLKNKIVDGVVLCSNCCADVGLDTVEWTRNWMKEVGDEKIT